MNKKKLTVIIIISLFFLTTIPSISGYSPSGEIIDETINIMNVMLPVIFAMVFLSAIFAAIGKIKL